MSQAEIERFVSDLSSNETLREAVVSASEGVESLVAIAQGQGYDINIDEANEYLAASQNVQLNDDQLDTVAGGKTSAVVLVAGGGSHEDPSSAVVVAGVAWCAVSAT